MKELNDTYLESLESLTHMEEPPEQEEMVFGTEFPMNDFIPQKATMSHSGIDQSLVEAYGNSQPKNYELEQQLKSEVGQMLVFNRNKDGEITSFKGFSVYHIVNYLMRKKNVIRNEYVKSGMYYDELRAQWYLQNAKDMLTNAVLDTFAKAVPAVTGDTKFNYIEAGKVADGAFIRANDGRNKVNPFQFKEMKYLVGVKHGMTYDFRTNKTRPSVREDYLTERIDYELIENEHCITEDYLKFLTGDSYKTFMQYIGYCFARTYSLEQTFLLLTDNKTDDDSQDGSNGKTTILKYLSKLFKTTAVAFNLKDVTSGMDKFATSNFFTKHVAIDDDASSKAFADTTTLKSLTGSSPIIAQYKGKDAFTFTNYAKLMFSVNKLPRFNDDSVGFSRRICVIPFIRYVTKKDPNTENGVSEDLQYIMEHFPQEVINSDEEIGKFAWRCIQEFRNLWFTEKGEQSSIAFYESKLSNELKEFWNKENDSMTTFIETYFEPSDNEKDRVPLKVITKLYEVWADESGVPRDRRVGVTANGFKHRLRKSLQTILGQPHIKNKISKIVGTQKTTEQYHNMRIKKEHYATYETITQELF